MNTSNYISINGITKAKLIEYIQQFCNTYSSYTKTHEIIIYSSKRKSNTYIIIGSEDMSFEDFKYLVNFLNYPENNTSYDTVRGFYDLVFTPEDTQTEIDLRLMCYVSKHDSEGDNVFGAYDQIEGTFKLGFGSKSIFEKLDIEDLDFYEPKINRDHFQELITIHPKGTTKLSNNKGCILVLLCPFIPSIWMFLSH